MTWDHHGRRIEDEEEAAERAIDLMSGDDIQSALDRANLVWLIDAYAGQKLMLLLRMVTAGPTACWLSTRRLARDCNMAQRTAELYRSALVEDRIVFKFNWCRVVELACKGLMRRPARERVAIIDRIFRPIINRNALAIDRNWLERWSDPATKSGDSTPAHFKRKRQNPGPRQGIHAPRQGIQDPDMVSVPPDSMSGPSKPELNPNPEPESQNATPLDAGRPVRHRVKQLERIQIEYAGKLTLIVQVLDVLNSDSAPWSRGEIADALDAHPSQVGRALGRLCRRGYAERLNNGRYVVTPAWTEAYERTQQGSRR